MTGDTPGPLGEFDRIRRHFRPLTRSFPGSLGLTNDAALIDVPPGRQLIVTTDGMVAGVHFLASDPPADIAAKLLRVNLSDVAAMGAAPLAYTLVTALPKAIGDDWLAAFAAGLAEEQARFGIGLAGGDSVSTSGPISLTVTAFGLVPTGEGLPRSGGKPGDLVFVTGTIGDAALGLRIQLDGRDPADADEAYLLGRLRRPEPRMSVGPLLRGIARAALDVSDGLVADLGHIAEESALRAEIDVDRVPLSDAARRALSRGTVSIAALITGGDDYELLFSAPADRRDEIAALATRTGVPITEIGRLSAGEAGRVEVLRDGGVPLALSSRGWTHF